ncbi:MAG: 50S ribosomal protein L10 [Clostridia bacterium]|nr:50S ribosomal protein L10 [Clostridia bacterium]
MPSAKVLEAKQQQVENIKTQISESCTGLLVDFTGISVEDDTKLRADLRQAGVTYKSYKNTLINLAIKDTDLDPLCEHLVGATAIASSKDDYAAAARILSKYIETSKSKTFVIKGGYLDGEPIGLDKIDSLAKLPDRETLLSMVANVFQAPMASFARVIQAIVDKAGEGAAEPAAEEAAPAAEETAAAPAE